jgi:hypothetical protein
MNRAPTFCSTAAANAVSSSCSVLAVSTCSRRPSACAAACRSRVSASALDRWDLATGRAPASATSSSRLAPNTFMKLVPVTLPPGRLKLPTSPTLTGSSPITKMTGIVLVAAFAANAAGNVCVTITFGLRPGPPGGPRAFGPREPDVGTQDGDADTGLAERGGAHWKRRARSADRQQDRLGDISTYSDSGTASSVCFTRKSQSISLAAASVADCMVE